MIHAIFHFGPYTLDPESGSLMKSGSQVALGRRAFEVLLVLLEHAGEVVSHRDLIARVWPETVVEENNLRVQLSAIRRALSDGDNPTQYILNVPGRGYRFAAQVARESTTTDAVAPGRRLPRPLTRIVGRAPLVQDMVRELPGHRLSTLIGSGGLGKTSVALVVANEVQERFVDGSCFVDLASLTEPGLVPAAVADALRIPMHSEACGSALVEHLSDRQVLIVLDNCEHVIEQVAHFVETLLKGTPHVHFLATSREPLSAQGERIWRLQPLDIPPSEDPPDTLAELLTFPSVELFVERASAALDTFRVTDADVELLIRLCQKLEGIPLAIELAAARINVFGIEGLVTEIEDSLKLLTHGRRTAQPRHRTLRATLDWSFDLLSEAEKSMFARLGVFTTGFTREAAMAVSCDDSLPETQAVECLSNLVAKSLVVVRFANGHVHFRLLDPTRSYALEKLGASSAENATRRRHAEYFHSTICRIERERGARVDRHPIDERLLIAEIRTALRWCFDEGGNRTLGLLLVAASSRLWYGLSLVDEYVSFVRRALSSRADTGSTSLESRRSEMRALLAMGLALFATRGSVDELVECYGSALDIAGELDDVESRKWALRGLWQYHHGLGEHDAALRHADAYEAQMGDTRTMTATRMRSITFTYQGELEKAQACFDVLRSNPFDASAISDLHTVDMDVRVVDHAIQARALWLRGFPSQALERAQQAMSIAVEGKHALSICYAAALGACPVALWSGELAMARRYLSLLEDRSGSFSLTFWYRFAEAYRRSLDIRNGERQRGRGDPPPYDAQWGYRHLEEFSVLGRGFSTRTLIERAWSPHPIWCSAEVLRLEALDLLDDNGAAGVYDAIAMLERSLDIARRQGALSWELRTSASLVRVLAQHGRNADAHELMTGMLERFPDSTETPDYVAALELMRAIAS